MNMYDAIKNFSEQFLFNPEIKNKEKFSTYRWYIVAGMGGSHLAADLLKIWKADISLIVHKNYGLPKVPPEILKNCLIILSSYSGNTEEVLDVYQQARKKNIPLAAISVGGDLLKRAQADGIPYIQLPDTGIQPRLSLGFFIKALLALIKKDKALSEVSALSKTLLPEELEKNGQELAEKMHHLIPVIYSSEANGAIAYNWKIKFNETGKIPAFCNVLPELNHNEMTGFDVKETTKNLSQKFCFILLEDKTDHPRIQKRMEILKKLYEDRKLPVIEIQLNGKNVLDKIFRSLILADWTSYHTAKLYNVEPEAVPMVEEFKKLIK